MNTSRFIPVSVALVVACSSSPVTIDQGVSGTVRLYSGNFIPGPGQTSPRGSPVAQRIVRVYPALSWSDVTLDDGPVRYVDPNPGIEPVSTVTSNNDGFYQAELPEGTYTVLVSNEGRWFCNMAQGDKLCVVTVSAEQVATYDLNIGPGSYY